MGKPVVLLSDDHASLRTLVRLALALRALGWDVRGARDGAGGLALARACAPAVVLVDLRLPDASGLDLLAELRALPGGQDRPVVALAGAAAPVAEARGRGAPCAAYLPKPVALADRRRLLDGDRPAGPAP